MSDVLFQSRAAIAPRSTNRADVALFVGTVQRRSGAVVDPIAPRARAADRLYAWLQAQGWTHAPNRKDQRPLEELLDVPVPIERWSEFERLFDWQTRSLDGGVNGATYLGAAVRSFFAEGGRRCYVVRVADPWSLGAARGERDAIVRLLIPEAGGVPTGSPVDRTTWRGVWHLYGLPDVSFVSIPELPDAVAEPPGPPEPLPPPKVAEERFVECSTPAPTPTPSFARRLAAPRCAEAGYQRWARALGLVLDAMTFASAASSLREVQLVAAVPLPDRRLLRAADADVLTFLRENVGLDRQRATRGLSSACLQLVYPWVRTPASNALPEGLENPEAVLIGVLAENALSRGSFQSAAGLATRGVLDVEPRLRASETASRLSVSRRAGVDGDALLTSTIDDAEQLAVEGLRAPAGPDLVTPVENLVRRVSLIGPTPSGFRLLSDVTTSRDPSYRQAQLGRLVVAVIRAARRAGEEELFAPSAPEAWSSVRARLGSLLSGLWRAGALRGAREQDAYSVRCDRSTMTDDDIDNGRVIAEVAFDAASSIDRITVSLSLADNSGFATRSAS